MEETREIQGLNIGKDPAPRGQPLDGLIAELSRIIAVTATITGARSAVDDVPYKQGGR